MAQAPQTLENHSRIVTGFHIVAFSGVVAGVLWTAYLLFRAPSLATVMGLVQALTIGGLFWYCRIFPLTAQDRVIRLEERLRLTQLLPADLQPRIGELTRGQLVALRFASDGEIAELVRRVLAGELASPPAIKQAIKSWRADYLRV